MPIDKETSGQDQDTAARIRVRSGRDPLNEIDVTDVLTQSLAYELWSRFGGDCLENWTEAQRMIRELAQSAQGESTPPRGGGRSRGGRKGKEGAGRDAGRRGLGNELGLDGPLQIPMTAVTSGAVGAARFRYAPSKSIA